MVVEKGNFYEGQVVGIYVCSALGPLANSVKSVGCSLDPHETLLLRPIQRKLEMRRSLSLVVTFEPL